MAVSLASTLTPHLWRGEPKVVIRGKFVFGLVRTDEAVESSRRAYFAPNLTLADPDSSSHRFIEPLVPGAALTIQVLGRSVPQGMSPDGPVMTVPTGLGQAVFSLNAYSNYYDSPNAGIQQAVRDLFPSNPYLNNAKDMFFAPKVFFDPGNDLSDRAFQLTSLDEGNAYYIASALGTMVAPDLRIVVRGALASLDITKIAAIGFPPDSSSLGYHALAGTPWWSSHFQQAGAGFSPEGVGWRAVDVHIYDNPGLRGHVTAGDVPVLWG